MLGDLDLVRPLGRAGIPCAVVAPARDPALYSRFAAVKVEAEEPWDGSEDFLERLERLSASREEQPVLMIQTDSGLDFASRWRSRLRRSFRFLLADESLLPDLIDKARFRVLAERLRLPVPPSQVLEPGSPPGALELDLPVVLKPTIVRHESWDPVAGLSKAIRVDSDADLHDVLERLAPTGTTVLAQEIVPGPESRVESYHVYVDGSGVAAEFTGRKVRTFPESRGISCALETSDPPDVAALGRDIVGRLGLRGVAKLDFKRAPDDRLWLLEVNPRFTLWHHLAAAGGLNIPALVYADLVGLPRPPARRVEPGLRWSLPWLDYRSARGAGVPLRSWLRWTIGAETKSVVALDDPMPFLRIRAPEIAWAIWAELRRRR